MDQGILAKAFRGELIPQDPNDEPACELLQRIGDQRTAAESDGKFQRKLAHNRSVNFGPLAPCAVLPNHQPDRDPQSVLVTRDGPVTAPAPTNGAATEGLPLDEAMAAYRASLWGVDALPGIDLMRAAADRLGYQRLGKNVRAELEGLLRKAARRKIVERDGDHYHCPTSIFRNYDREFLITQLKPVMRKGQEYTRDEVAQRLATHLGYANVTSAMRDHLKGVFNAALRRGVLQKQGKRIWRE